MFSGVLVCIKITPRLSGNHGPRLSSSPPSPLDPLWFESTSTPPRGPRGQLAVLIQGTLAASGRLETSRGTRAAFAALARPPVPRTALLANVF